MPENKMLSPSELKGYREDVSVLLEKAMLVGAGVVVKLLQK